MNQTTKYWISQIYDWEFEEDTCDTKHVVWMRSLFYRQQRVMSWEPVLPALPSWRCSVWLTAELEPVSHRENRGSTLPGATQPSYAGNFLKIRKLKREEGRSKTSINILSSLPSLNQHTHTHAEEPESSKHLGGLEQRSQESTFIYPASAARNTKKLHWHLAEWRAVRLLFSWRFPRHWSTTYYTILTVPARMIG